MIRTQIYLPDELHAELHRVAKDHDTTFSHLIREGAQEVVKKKKKGKNPQREALLFFANPPKRFRIKLSDSAENLVRKERD